MGVKALRRILVSGHAKVSVENLTELRQIFATKGTSELTLASMTVFYLWNERHQSFHVFWLHRILVVEHLEGLFNACSVIELVNQLSTSLMDRYRLVWH